MAGPCISQLSARKKPLRNAARRGNTSRRLVSPRASTSAPEPNLQVVPHRSVYPSLDPGSLFRAQCIVGIGRAEAITVLPAHVNQQSNETLAVVGLAQPSLQVQILQDPLAEPLQLFRRRRIFVRLVCFSLNGAIRRQESAQPFVEFAVDNQMNPIACAAVFNPVRQT